MEKYARKKLNVSRLMALGVLDVRKAAFQNETLTAEEYFTNVEKFIENAPSLRETLLRALNILSVQGDSARDAEALSALEGISALMSDIGCGSLSSGLESIIDGIKSGNARPDELRSAGAAAAFDALSEKLASAYSKKRFSSAKPGDETDADILLSEALERLDYEEENRKLRILAVDDISVVLNTLTSLLSPYYEVFALKSSSQVEPFLEHTTPELFLLDIEMNEISGFDLVPLIRKFEKHKDTPIIFLTGNASYDNLKDAVALGACDFITKPVNQSVLLEKIEKNITRKKSF